MPIYEYACETCGHQQEALQGMKDAPLTECEHCHKSTLVRLVSAAGFRLKGGGWYETDFKSATDKKKNLAPDETTTSPAANDSKKNSTANPSKENTSSSSNASSSTGTSAAE